MAIKGSDSDPSKLVATSSDTLRLILETRRWSRNAWSLNREQRVCTCVCVSPEHARRLCETPLDQICAVKWSVAFAEEQSSVDTLCIPGSERWKDACTRLEEEYTVYTRGKKKVRRRAKSYGVVQRTREEGVTWGKSHSWKLQDVCVCVCVCVSTEKRSVWKVLPMWLGQKPRLGGTTRGWSLEWASASWSHGRLESDQEDDIPGGRGKERCGHGNPSSRSEGTRLTKFVSLVDAAETIVNERWNPNKWILGSAPWVFYL